MNVFMVSYDFEPKGGAQPLNATRAARQLAIGGHGVVVFTAAMDTAGSGYGWAPVPNVRVVRVPDDETGDGAERARARIWTALKGRIRWLEHTPDGNVAWFFRSRGKALRALLESRADLIYSRSTPPTSHLLGGWLQRRTALPWIAHFSDPWVDNPYLPVHVVGGFANRTLERRVISRADALVFTNEIALEFTMDRYPRRLREKASVVPHCFEAPPEIPIERENDPGSVFAHVGELYGLRSPAGLLAAIARLSSSGRLPAEFRLVFVGSISRSIRTEIDSTGLDPVVTVAGEVPYADSLRWMRSSDVLVSIDAPCHTASPFLPSKLLEYAGAGRPILNLTSPDSASERFTREVGGITARPDKPEEIANAIIELLASAKDGWARFTPRQDAVKKYRAEKVGAQLNAVFNHVWSARHPFRSVRIANP